MELGDAPQGQGVLHPAAPVLLHNARPLEHPADVLRGVELVRVGPDGHHPGVEGVDNPFHGLQGHGPHDVGGLGGVEHVIEGQGGHGGGGGGARHQGQPLLGGEDHGLQPGPGQRLGPLQQLALVVGLPPAQQHQGHMGLGGEVAHAAVSGGVGGQTGVEEVPVFFQYAHPHAAVPLADVLQHHKHDAPHPLHAQGLAHRDGVGQNDVLLELGGGLLVDGLGAQGPEAGGDAIHHPLLLHPLLHQSPGTVYAGYVFRGKRHLPPEPGHGDEVLQGDGLAQS